jgi:hypothetical protein
MSGAGPNPRGKAGPKSEKNRADVPWRESRTGWQKWEILNPDLFWGEGPCVSTGDYNQGAGSGLRSYVDVKKAAPTLLDIGAAQCVGNQGIIRP